MNIQQRTTFIVTLIFCATISLKAQRNHLVYAEAMGNGLIYSVNFDTRFKKAINGPGVRLGIGAEGSSSDFTTYIPTQVNYVLGSKHALEVGIGVVSVYGTSLYDDVNRNHHYEIHPNACMLYRFQGNKGVNFRIGWTPVFVKKKQDYAISSLLFALWPGMSLGYAF
jgi:hypothetical protein